MDAKEQVEENDSDQAEKAHLNDGSDKEYATFEAQNRRRRIFIVGVAIVVGVVSIAAMVATMGSIGKMSAQVEDAFMEGKPEDSEPAKSPNQPSSAP